jgi:FkbM family methyltransferase
MMLLDGHPFFFGNECFYHKINEDRGIKVYYSFVNGMVLKKRFIEKIRERMLALKDYCVGVGEIVPVEIDLTNAGTRIVRSAWGLEVQNIACPKDAWIRYCRGEPYDWNVVAHPDHNPDGFKRFVRALQHHVLDAKNTTLGSIMWGTRVNRWFLIDGALTEQAMTAIQHSEEARIDKEKPRKIYIDCGAFRGDTIKAFLNSEPNSSEYEIYAFEPNPYSRVHKRYGHLFKVYHAATWIADGEMPFYISEPKTETQAGTLLKQKTSGNLDKKHPIMVKTMDFSKWVADNFKLDDHVVVKMDIEGAEYKVLPKMIADGSICCIDRLYLETHENRIGLTAKDFNTLMDGLRKVPGLEIHENNKKGFSSPWVLVRGVPSGKSDDSESTRLRFYRKLNYLPSKFKWKPVKDEFRCDVLYIQKRAEQIPLIMQAKEAGIPVVYDSDDGDGLRRKGDDRPVFPLVDAITTDSEERAEAFRRITTTPVYVVPDGLDYIDKQPEPIRISGTIKRVCTFGSDRSTNAAIDYLLALQDLYEVSYITKTKIEKLKHCRYIEWNQKNFFHQLTQHDVCVLVHENTEEKQFKSNIRLITAMSVGLPTITDNTPAYVTEMTACGVQNLIVANPTELVTKMQLLDDKGFRQELQAKAMHRAWSTYDPFDMAEKLADVFNKVMEAKNGINGIRGSGAV